jgi:hypothetical protein
MPKNKLYSLGVSGTDEFETFINNQKCTIDDLFFGRLGNSCILSIGLITSPKRTDFRIL